MTTAADDRGGEATADRAGGPTLQERRYLDRKVAVVTGSSSGIGEAIARRLAAAGAKVVVNSVRSVERGEEIAASLPGSVYVRADASVEEDVDRLVSEALGRFGRIDVLVNNAATTKLIPFEDLDTASAEVWRRILEVNLIGPFLMTRAAVPALRERGGCVLNVSSLAGSRAVGSSIPYAASKAALNHLTRMLARTLAPDVRVNAVAPGFVATPWTAAWGPEPREQATRASPLGRVATPEDVAEVATMLIGSSYVTGEVVIVDGGLGLV